MRPVLPPDVVQPVGREPDLLDSLLVIDNELVEWILHASPGNDEEKKQMRQVLALRSRLEQDINKLALDRMRLSTAGLEPHAARLNDVSQQVSATAKAIGSVKEVLDAAEEAVTIAARAVANVAG